MKAYKVFNPDWTCRNMQYEVGKTYEIEGEPVICKRGFHACVAVADCFNYYLFDPSNKVAEVELDGKIVTEGGDKHCASRITVVRELTWGEMLTLANTGKGNSGVRNAGAWNAGDGNTGNWNTGNRNTGNWNTGNWNTGDRNPGAGNTGAWNTGNRNTGDWNTGDWNTGNRNSGFFNTDTPTVRMFNKDSGLTFAEINFPSFLYFDVSEWVEKSEASDAERVTRAKEIETTGGFLRKYEYKEAFAKAWNSASDEERLKVQRLPNFDAAIFFEISGIDLR